MRLIFRPNGRQYHIKCGRKPSKVVVRVNKGGTEKIWKISLAKRVKGERRVIKISNVPAADEIKSSISQAPQASASSSSSSEVLETPKILNPSTQSLSSSPPLSSCLLQTLPSPTDEFKGWPSSSSSSIENDDVQQQQQEQRQKQVQQHQHHDQVSENGKNKASVVGENANVSKHQQHISALTMNELWSTAYNLSSNNNEINSETNPLSRDAAKALLLQKYKERMQCLNQVRQIQSLSIASRRPQQIEPESNNINVNTNNNNSINGNNNNNNINVININNNVNNNNCFHGNNNNNSNSIGNINISGGVKRPLVQDDPNEPEPTSSENIKRIKVANGYQNVAILDDRYLFIRKIEGTSFYYCIDAKARKRLMCKVSLDPCTKLIEAHAKLNAHPCISQLLKVIRKENKTYMFFPMAQDDLLSYVRRRKRLPERDARFLFRQMCAIVRACHNQGIVLRDLKLRKFIFSDGFKKHLKLESLVDAVVLEHPTNDLLKEKRGCPVYVAPEILKTTQTYCGKAADMWSLGVILYTMLIGRYPFSDTEHAALFAKISRGQFTLPDIISPKARCIIRCLLRQEPEERITSEDIFYHPWMNVNDATEINLLQTDQCVPTNDYIGRENCGNNNNNNKIIN